MAARRVLLTILLLVGVGAAGCRDKPPRFTKAQLDQIQKGMTEKEVTDLLGQPDEAVKEALEEGGKLQLGGSVWRDGKRSVTVLYLDGKVTRKKVRGY